MSIAVVIATSTLIDSVGGDDDTPIMGDENVSKFVLGCYRQWQYIRALAADSQSFFLF
jgi:hypothetical protein